MMLKANFVLYDAAVTGKLALTDKTASQCNSDSVAQASV